MAFTTRRNYRLFLYVNSMVIIVLGAILAGGGVFLTVPSGLGEGYHAIQASLRVISNVLFWRVAILYAVISLLIIISMVMLHLLYSHRIAGPAYRIGREAAKIAQGNLSGNIKFRQKDNLTDMAESLNDVASQYRDRIKTVNNYLSTIESQSKTISDIIQLNKDKDVLKQAVESIANNVRNIEISLSEIKT
ncbi:MAG TPA: methyl-accepting chemotaxis protein [Nitrospirota bacterium]|nr:methyl-accepting chemotaxis protein [Nitrospirota bacterium]